MTVIVGDLACIGATALAVVAAFSAFGQAAREPDPRADRAAFERASGGSWREVFFDDGAGDWTERWFLDGEVGAVTNSDDGMQLTAGPRWGVDAHHMVLWTKAAFEGDLKIEYAYTRLDFERRGVNILYVQATGSGLRPYEADIEAWAELRRVPAMRMYFDHMHAYHISYAAFGPPGEDQEAYVRARRYRPHRDGLRGTSIEPDYPMGELFEPGAPHEITVIKRADELLMRVENESETRHFRWRNTTLPAIESGRVGLRIMFTRSARFSDFRISVPAGDG